MRPPRGIGRPEAVLTLRSREYGLPLRCAPRNDEARFRHCEEPKATRQSIFHGADTKPLITSGKDIAKNVKARHKAGLSAVVRGWGAKMDHGIG